MSGIAAAFGYDGLLKDMKGDKGDYYHVPNFKDYKKGEKAKLKDGYISSSVPLHSGYGDPEYIQKPTGEKHGRTGKDSYGYIKGSGRAGHYIYKDPNFQKDAPAPAPSPPATAPEPKAPVVLSDKVAKAKAYTTAYQNVFLPRQGDYNIRNDQSVISDFNDTYKLNLAKESAPQPAAGQSFKDSYQANLSEELKDKDPSTFAATKTKYQKADQQAANLNDNFELNLGAFSFLS